MVIGKRLAVFAATAATALTLAMIPPLLTTASATPSGAAFHQIAHRIGYAHLSRGVSSGGGGTPPAAGADAAKTGKAIAKRSPRTHQPVPPPAPSGATCTSLAATSGTA